MAPSVGIYVDGLVNRHIRPDTQTALRITMAMFPKASNSGAGSVFRERQLFPVLGRLGSRWAPAPILDADNYHVGFQTKGGQIHGIAYL